MPQAARPYVTRGTSIACYQDARKHNLSRVTEQPLVTDHDSTTVKGISLSHETNYVHQAQLHIPTKPGSKIHLTRESMKPPVKLVSSGCCFVCNNR